MILGFQRQFTTSSYFVSRLLLLICICLAILSLQGAETAGEEMVLPINLSNPDGSKHEVNLTFSAHDQRLEFIVADFCEQHNIRSFYCRKLFEVAMQTKQNYLSNQLQARKKYSDKPPFESDLFHENQMKKLSSSKPRASPFDGVPNSHLARNVEAVQAELLQTTERHALISRIEEQEKRAFEAAKNYLSQKIEAGITVSRIVALHSCLFSNQSTAVLEKLLRKIDEAKVLSSATPGVILVFHYGASLPSSFTSSFARQLSVTTSSSLLVVHVSEVASFFEIPTIRIITSLAQYLTSTTSSPHFLYLHTKGVSYDVVYPQIEDWVDMMLHFLVERQRTSYHLLHSGEFDAVGCNYCSHPYRMFSGNYWWVTSAYLASLSASSTSSLSYNVANKYDAERFLFLSPKIRIFSLHTSNVYHASLRYPHYCYRASSPPPTFEEFVRDCQEDNIEEYRALHVTPYQGNSPRPSPGSERDPATNTHPSSARCNALELYNYDSTRRQ